MKIDAVDLFEIGKYIDSPLEVKFFQTKVTLVKSSWEQSEINVDKFTARKKVKVLKELPMFHHGLQIHRCVHSARYPPGAGLTFPT